MAALIGLEPSQKPVEGMASDPAVSTHPVSALATGIIQGSASPYSNGLAVADRKEIAAADAVADEVALKNNTDLAEKANAFVNSQILLIVNYLNRDRTAAQFEQAEGKTMAECAPMLEQMFEELKGDKNPQDYMILTAHHVSHASKERAVCNIAKTFTELKIGTCIEMSAVCYAYCKNQGIPTEIFLVVPGNHAILVIGRDPNSSPNDFRTWGPKAVICDSWANEVYSASEIPQRLKIYSETGYNEDGSVTTHLTPFSYLKHKFSLLV